MYTVSAVRDVSGNPVHWIISRDGRQIAQCWSHEDVLEIHRSLVCDHAEWTALNAEKNAALSALHDAMAVLVEVHHAAAAKIRQDHGFELRWKPQTY